MMSSGIKTFRPCPWRRVSESSSSWSTGRRCPIPCTCTGTSFQVVEIDGARFAGAVRDTVLVPPGRRVVAAFDVDNPGLWAFHCHLLYHLDAGMFTTLQYV